MNAALANPTSQTQSTCCIHTPARALLQCLIQGRRGRARVWQSNCVKMICYINMNLCWQWGGLVAIAAAFSLFFECVLSVHRRGMLVDTSQPAAECGGFVQFNSTLFVLTFATLKTVLVLVRNPEPDPRGKEKTRLTGRNFKPAQSRGGGEKGGGRRHFCLAKEEEKVR